MVPKQMEGKMIFATALVVLGLAESADALVPQQLARALVAMKHASAQTSVSPRTGACSSHSDCGDDNYCDTAMNCFSCSACAFLDDAIDGTCPPKCGDGGGDFGDLCNDGSGWEELFGADLLECLCENGATSATDSGLEIICKCEDEFKSSASLQLAAAFSGQDPDDYFKETVLEGGECPSDDPCFARDTLALLPSGERVPMASLKAGDLVMDGPSSVARVIVNQHREATFKSALLELEHANGILSLTPDHVLEVDGKFVPARMVAAGSKLGESEVSRVVASVGEVINPLTTSGKILTQGGVLASTYPEWVAEYMLSSYLVPLPLSLSNLLSYLFPETAQAYYDALIEPLVTKAHPKHLKAALPAPLLPAAFLVGDLAVSVGFAAFALASPLGVAAVAVLLAAKMRKARK